MNTQDIQSVKSLIRNGGTLLNFSGPRNVGLRQHLLYLLTGTRPPQGAAGINNVEREVFKAAGVDTSAHCLKICRDMVDAWAKS